MSTPGCEHLEAYIGEGLAATQRSAFEAHLQDCAKCQAELRKQERVDLLLGAARTQLEPVPPSLEARIRAQLERSPRGRPGLRVLVGLSAAAALLLVVLLPVAQRKAARIADLPGTGGPPEATEQDHARTDLEDRPAALQQLAILIAGQSQRASTSRHPWLRLATMAVPLQSGPAQRRSVTDRNAAQASSPTTTDTDPQEVKVTRGPPPFNARAIRSRLTLGQRKLSDRLPVLPEARESLGQNGNDI